jgi:hypothetical protein
VAEKPASFRRSLLLPMFMTSIFLAVGSVSATASPATIFRFPYQPNPANQCTAEMIAFEGQAQLVLQISSNPDGSFHVREHFNTQGVSGTGLSSGDSYSYSETSGSQQEYDVGATLTETHTLHELVLIHAGETLANDDRHDHVNVSSTFTEGVPTVRIDNTRSECK